MKRLVSIILATALSVCAFSQNISSPDRKLNLRVDKKTCTYSVKYDGQQVMAGSVAQLELYDGSFAWEEGAKVKISKKRKVREQIDATFYKQKSFEYVYNSMVLDFKNGFSMEWRLSDCGLAYRFSTTREGETVIKNETGKFAFCDDAVLTSASPFENNSNPYRTSFENTYTDAPLSAEMKKYAFIPVVLTLPSQLRVVVAESSVSSYPGAFARSVAGENTLAIEFPPYPEKDFIAVSSGSRNYPWRILKFSTDDRDIPADNLVYALAEPSRIEDISWIKPGFSAWEWWNDWRLEGVGFESGINFETYKYHIDYAAEQGIQYVLLDEGWGKVAPGQNYLKPKPGFDLEGLAHYAKSKGVGLILWCMIDRLSEDPEMYCEMYGKMEGVAGFKPDFLNLYDQKAVERLARIAEAAARNHLFINVHGVFPPSGLNRTYPNILNMEGVWGLENCRDPKDWKRYMKQDVMIPFTRLFAGPCDYTPGALHNYGTGNPGPEGFIPGSYGTRAHQVALFGVYEMPLSVVCDSPTDYEADVETVSFITACPREFDESRVLEAKMGEYITVARRSGDKWVVSGITGIDARDTEVDFSFLGEGEWDAVAFEDVEGAAPTDYKIERFTVRSTDKKSFRLVQGGGFAIRLQKATKLGYVNLFMGTAGDHGQVSPAAQVPFGLISVCPDAVKPLHAGYDYNQAEISGISVTRINGVGGDGTGGNLRLRPAAVEEKLEIIKGSETAFPGYYEARLNNGVGIKLTATRNIAVENFQFSGNAAKRLVLDVNSAIDPRRSACGWKVLDANNIEGWAQTSTTCNFGAYKLYFRLRTNRPFTVGKVDGDKVELIFPDKTRSVEARVALSPVDEATAAKELQFADGMSFDKIRRVAAEKWENILSRADVEGSTEEQKILFYTSMYRVFLSPFNSTSSCGQYRGTDGELHAADNWTYYSGWSMWDTFRTKFPMISLMAPEEMSDICKSLVSLYVTGKKNWATLHECAPTVRTEHAQITLLDAWSKGIRGFDLDKAFPGMEKEYEDGLAPGSGQGLTRNTPDQKMETVYDLWAMSKIAEIIGNDAAATKYGRESERLFEETWKKEFMTITDEFALMKGNGMYQGTRWQYRWAMPLYADKMAEWVGKETLASQLAEFFEKHLFNQGNEPDIQTPFMFNLFGHPERTGELVHALLTDDRMIHIYGGNAEFPQPFVGRAFQNKVDGYAPEMDEDDGAMSAWYMFSQMGFYPLCVGTDRYEMFTPLFEKITLHLNGRDITIRRGCPEGAGAKRIVVDGKPLPGFTITHDALVSAREIVFE
ncbi:MAG: GH92 family glycosyl hydrolase [Bacteroidota bacterium]|jgi:predicted alpha-1,2-mannosidase|nr:GH92 family glycosyl hydrolase [Bacteroidota bacterium]